MAKTLGRLHTVFKNRLSDLTEQAAAAAAAEQGGGQRQWQIPSDLETELYNVPQLHEPSYNREEINANYEEVMADAKNGGTTADVIAIKMQLDYVAAEERAFRTRHAGLIRCRAHAAARREGHGNSSGIFVGGIQRAVDDILRSGGMVGSVS